ncbi:leucine-rich repeat- and IQ domain-containing protein 1 [Genypterus blacodes]|uniref:leucine-rich repeat- and IQ domain-containing protein 1 n=1 Tax=Genypterus blacodes TaxID=154954 RepID=UPI003F75782B
MEKEELRRQRDKDLQEELRRIEEAEKIHQRELELMEQRAQETLAQELQHQQELIGNLQRQVDEEQKRSEEEKRKMEEEERRRREERRKREEEEGRRKEEERKQKEEEERRQKEEEERIKEEEEERRVKEEEKKRKEEEERMKKEGEERRVKEEEKKRKEEEERMKKEGEERQRKEEERKQKEEEERMKREEEDRQRKEEEKKRKEEEESITWEEEERRKKEEEEMRKREEEIFDAEVTRKRRVEVMMKEEEKNQTCEEAKDLMSTDEDIRFRQNGIRREVENGEKVWKLDKETESKGEDEKNKREEEDHDRQSVRLKGEEEKKKKLESEGMRRREEEQSNQPERKRLMEEDGTSSGPGTVSQTPDPAGGPDPAPAPSSSSSEQRRLSWMSHCTSWTRLSFQNRKRQRRAARSRRAARRPAESAGLPPLSPDALLQAGGWRSLREVTSVTLEDLPGCSLSTLAQCPRIQSLTVRRCGLRALDGLSQLTELRYIDVQDNDITFVDCEQMSNLRVLRLGRNQLTSIHGLSGVDQLDVLDLSHNCITRITGLESMRKLQRLSVDHNQLISTKGLRDVYTLLHLDCSHNHLRSVEGLESCALLNTLDLSANSLTEPPCLENQVLLRELRLDDNSISTLQGLTACWLPLMQLLSVAQNRVTQLPLMSDCLSLEHLDLQHNCLSELRNVCESLEGCGFLRQVHLTGNPLQQERRWRSTLQKAVPALSTGVVQETEASLSHPAAHLLQLPSGSFLTFCQAQLQQTHDLLQRHSVQLSDASSPLDALEISCRHSAEALQLAEDHRFAHEYGDTVVPNTERASGPTAPEGKLRLDTDVSSAAQLTEHAEVKPPGDEEAHCAPSVILSEGDVRGSRTREEEESAERRGDTSGTGTTEQKMERSVTKAMKGKTHRSHLTTLSPQEPDPRNTAAVMIQQWWRKHREKWKNINIRTPPAAEQRGGRGGNGPSPVGWSVDQHYAATVLQAFWRGFRLRKRLASALYAATRPVAGEDDTFEEVDVDEFVFDEAALEKDWTLLLPEDSLPKRDPAPKQPVGAFSQPPYSPLPPPPACRPKQAWAATAVEQVDVTEHRASPESNNRSKRPSHSAHSEVSEKLENILSEWGFTDSRTALLMLKRAQKMQSKKQRSLLNPSVHLGLFRNFPYQFGPEEAPKRPIPDKLHDTKGRAVCRPSNPQVAPITAASIPSSDPSSIASLPFKFGYGRHNAQSSLHLRVCQAEAGAQRAGGPERQSHAAVCDRQAESRHFLPRISADVLQRGRVQLTARSGYTEHLHQPSGSLASSSFVAQPGKERSYPRRNSWGHARKEVPSPKQAPSASSKKERISFRDNPVELGDGWGGGKKRDKIK